MKPKSEQDNLYDVFVIGGGVNGVGVAHDAATRGFKVCLAEMNDLASATSSNSSKLIHGGLRYLEHYEFRLVKEALAEREVLLQNSPHIMWPLRFILPHQRHLRPAWMIRIGLFLYDNLAKRATLKGSHQVKMDDESPLKSDIVKGFEYSDGWVDDSRLVVLNAMAARELGADIHTNTKCVKAVREGQHWAVTLQDKFTNETKVVYSRTLVNASGPWVQSIFGDALESKSPKKVRLVKGSHIVVPKLHDKPEAYILQNEDNRIVFVIPFEDDFSLVGTTDVEHEGSADTVKISDDEIEYIMSISNQYFKKQINKSDIVHTYAGVRPLLDDESDSAQSVTRDYTFELSKGKNQATLLSIFGGKITTYRKLASAAVDALLPALKSKQKSKTKTNKLPGGDFDSKDALLNKAKNIYSGLDEKYLARLIRNYGTRLFDLLGDARNVDDLGICFGHDLYQKEVDYLVTQEWACTAEDIIWRRTKRGLYLNENNIAELHAYLSESPVLSS